MRKTAPLLILALATFRVAGSADAAISAAERAALIALHDSANGAEWTTRTNWLGEPGTECTWHGVTCDDAQSTVTRVELPSNQLIGVIPSEIGALTNLQQLRLGRNALDGAIPAELGNLGSLERLELHGNTLRGALAPELASLSAVTHLQLEYNALHAGDPGAAAWAASRQAAWATTQTIPPVAIEARGGSLSVSVSWSQLTHWVADGSIEALVFNGDCEEALCPLVRSQSTDKRNTRMTIPELPGPGVYRIILRTTTKPHADNLNTVISDHSTPAVAATIRIPDAEREALIALYNSTNGDGWKLAGNWLGSIGTECTWTGVRCAFDHVTELYLAGNQLSGTIPEEIGNFSKLQKLNFWMNQVGGSIPKEIGELTLLEELDVRENRLSGPIPEELGRLNSVRRIRLESNELVGSIPKELGSLKSLQFLGLANNRLSGSIPPELASAPYLDWFSSSGNDLEGTIPKEFGTASFLRVLILSNNRLGGEIPPELGSATRLEAIMLDHNQFSGPIPPELGNLPWLSQIRLHANALIGSIPPELGQLTRLEMLLLDDNQLTGTIPSELANAWRLSLIRLGGNRLTGSIPSEFGRFPRSLSLDLHSNELSGPIPPELFSQAKLWSLDVSSNRLSGRLPSEVGDAISLRTLNLQSNQLVGPIPSTIKALTELSDLRLEYNGLYTTDPAVDAWATARQADWKSTQTVFPGNVAAVAVSATTAELTWDPISYTADAGGYEVWVDAAGCNISPCPRDLAGATANKNAQGLTITGLAPAAQRRFHVRTITEPHAANVNTVVSDFSAAVVSVGPGPDPSVSINDISVLEGHSGTSNATLTANLSAASGATVSVLYGTADGTASAGSDYVAANGTITFSPGETARPITVTVLGNTEPEGNKVFFVNLSAPVNATIGKGVGRVTILDDDLDLAPAPDPAILTTGCTVVLGPCTMKATSIAGGSIDGWTITWSLDGLQAASGPVWSPSLTLARAYEVVLTASNEAGVGTATVTIDIEDEKPCPSNALCADGGRFTMTLEATDPRTGSQGQGLPIKQNDLFGFFSIPALTFDPDNPEVFVKVLDGRTVNGHYWVFYGGLTDFAYTISVSDTVDGTTRTYTKPGGSPQGGFDVGGGVTPEECSGEVDGIVQEPVVPADCGSSDEALCLGGRFLVELKARDHRTERTGSGLAMPKSDLFGYFAIPDLTFNPDNPEVFVKVLDGRAVNGYWWVFYSGLTDLEYTVRVTDTMTGERKSYTKAPGSACGAFDVSAF